MRLARCAIAVVLLAACAQPVPSSPVQPAPTTGVVPPTPVPTTTSIEKTAISSAPPLVRVALTPLARTLHPYPDTASYTAPWLDAAALIWGGADGGGGLLAFDWTALAYRPAMAREMPRVSEDGRTFAFTLRTDLKWSDGSPISVDDFQFAYEQASREDNHYVQLDLVQEIASFKTTAPSSLVITLRDAKPRDLALGIANVITPVPKKVWQGKSWTDSSTNPEILNPSVVLGPFRVEAFGGSDRAVFTPVDTYYAGRIRVPRLDIIANQPPTTALDALKSGQANWLRNLPPSQYQDARASPSLAVQEWTAANASYRAIEFNLARPLLSDRRVRQAIALAVNRTDLIAAAEQGLAVPQYGFIQPTNQKWINPSVERNEYDLNRARQLLRDVGYPPTSGQRVKLDIVYPSSSVPREKIATYLQAQLQQLGIDSELVGLDFAAYAERVQLRRNFDISLATYGGGSLDPDLSARAQLTQNGTQNATSYANARVDELFRLGSLELNEGRRKALYDEAQTLVSTDVPVHYLYALKSVDALARGVRGVQPTRADRLDANDALLSWSVSS